MKLLNKAVIPVWRRVLYVLISPLIIIPWCIMHPKKFWEQFKQDFAQRYKGDQ